MSERGRLGSLYDAYLRKRPKQSRSRVVVEALLTAAFEALSRGDGEDDITLERIARRAGVGIGSLYDYFGDRGSLLAGVAAKITEDNLIELEKVLESSADLPIEDCVRILVDDLFARYLTDRRLIRSILRIAVNVGLTPVLADSQEVFARTLAAFLRRHKDVKVEDPDLTAYLMTNLTMGMIGTLVWSNRAPIDEARIKAEIVRVWVNYLRTG